MKKNINSDLSYPEDGNKICSEIEENSFWFDHRNNVFFEAISNHSKNEDFYDIGGGNGYISYFLQNNGISSTLIEPGINGINIAKGRGVQNTFHGILTDYNFDDSGLMKSAGCFDVIEHIEDDKTFIADIYERMEDGAYLYITVPAFNFLWSKEDIDAGHFRRYTLKTLRQLVSTANFKIVYQTYLFSILPLPIYIKRTLKYKLNPNTKKEKRKFSTYKNDHTTKAGLSSMVLDKVLNWEVSMVKKNRKIPVGSSCFIIVQK